VGEDRGIVAFVAPPWGTALDEMQGSDLRCTSPPIFEIIQQVAHRFWKQQTLLAMQVHEKVNTPSLNEIQTWLDRSELRIYDINKKHPNRGILLGTTGWAPR